MKARSALRSPLQASRHRGSPLPSRQPRQGLLAGVLRPASGQATRAEAGLAGAAYLLWLAAGCLAADVAASESRCTLALVGLRWKPDWPWIPAALAAGGLALALARCHRCPQRGRPVRQALRRLTLLTGALLGLRLAALFQPVLLLFPFLTFLWAPHSTWALSLLYLLRPNVRLRPVLQAVPGRRGAGRWIPAALLAGGLGVYGLYTLYFCQLAMLHGDEGQYLRVTQSLLHDGDIDLANNLAPRYTDEFHSVSFDVHPAPTAPPDRVYSVHPPGLSVLLLPAYGFGLEAWGNPRLGAALLMAGVSAACLPLAYLWLYDLGASRAVALCCALVLGSMRSRPKCSQRGAPPCGWGRRRTRSSRATTRPASTSPAAPPARSWSAPRRPWPWRSTPARRGTRRPAHRCSGTSSSGFP
ncbi:MAG: hypothetical protein AB1505_26450 [Candidatus Latescibacterota bacterium]